MDKTSLGDRMKRYEATTRTCVLPRTPVIVRVDGKAFHTWTKQLRGFDETLGIGPFSMVMHKAMLNAASCAAKQMQNFKLAYTQSDEISFLLNDWESLETQQWFGGGVQKIASVTASAVTAGFIQSLMEHCPEILEGNKFPMFDARVFQLPKEEVTNYFIWRQQDATRNSIQMLGRFYFSHKQLHEKNQSDIQDMLMLEKGVNWNNISTWMRRGSCVLRKYVKSVAAVDEMNIPVERAIVFADEEIPIFTQDRQYIEMLL